jgi:hypothetical protein
MECGYNSLSELIPWMASPPAEKRKPKALEAKERSGPSAPTILDQFVVRTDTAENEPNIIMNEDGTMGTVGNEDNGEDV